MLAGYKIISLQIELSKVAPISEKVKFICMKNVF